MVWFLCTGIASAILAAYLEHISGFSDLKRARLITKLYLLGFYTKAGFQFIRHSPVLHGRDRWLEMGIELDQNSVPRGLPWFHVDAFTSKAFSGKGRQRSSGRTYLVQPLLAILRAPSLLIFW